MGLHDIITVKKTVAKERNMFDLIGPSFFPCV